mmetsp:Transcript_988/g.2028  ORF Transcript_988/g.2028 Transcript_988/m.2028 type:complete len:487 (-) Transcript_988:215-1675(-)
MWHYQTKKYVTIRDWRLGVLHLLLQLFIILYIFGYTILYQASHLKSYAIDGNVMLTPTMARVDQECSILENASCAKQAEVSKLTYCSEAKEPDAYYQDSGLLRNCIQYSGSHLSTTQGQVSIPLCIELSQQKRVCHEPATCNSFTESWETIPGSQDASRCNYTAGVEEMSILFDHRYWVSQQMGVHGAAADIQGHVITNDNITVPIPWELHERLEPFPSLHGSDLTFGGGDSMNLEDLLKLAGTSLDKPILKNFTSHAWTHSNASLRWAGGILEVTIRYTNEDKWDFFGTAKTQYYMSANLVNLGVWDQQTKMTGSTRELYNTGPLVIQARVVGRHYAFSLSHLLIVLSSSVALLAMATTATDYLMTSILQNRDIYSTMKYQVSPKLDEVSQSDGELVGLHSYSVLEETAKGSTRIKEEALLPILMKMEQRLNSLDGFDHEMGLDDEKLHYADIQKRFDTSHSRRTSLRKHVQSEGLQPSRDSFSI